jgi:uncharacterized protein (DUF4213/DUF364 family)
MVAVPTIVVVVVHHYVVHVSLLRIVKVKIRLRELKVKDVMVYLLYEHVLVSKIGNKNKISYMYFTLVS